jgi:hypothetical protein
MRFGQGKRSTDNHGNETPPSLTASLTLIFASDEFVGEGTVVDLGVPGCAVESDIAREWQSNHHQPGSGSDRISEGTQQAASIA